MIFMCNILNVIFLDMLETFCVFYHTMFISFLYQDFINHFI